MEKYDPLDAPEPSAWLELEESESIDLVLAYHRTAGVAPPNERIHAVAHVIVENQIALGDETPVAGTLERLTSEGLDRHDAVHAIGTVLMDLMWKIQKGDISSKPDATYYAGLEKLTAESWRRECEKSDE